MAGLVKRQVRLVFQTEETLTPATPENDDTPDIPVALFTSEEEIPNSAIEMVMDMESWVDMGKPPMITVTIEPGDTLNERD